jgi:hypothetical protein
METKHREKAGDRRETTLPTIESQNLVVSEFLSRGILIVNRSGFKQLENFYPVDEVRVLELSESFSSAQGGTTAIRIDIMVSVVTNGFAGLSQMKAVFRLKVMA